MAGNSNTSFSFTVNSLNPRSKLKNIESAIIQAEKEIFLHFSSLISRLFSQGKAEKFANSIESDDYKLSPKFYKEYKKLHNEDMEALAENLSELEMFRAIKKDLWGDKIFTEGEINKIEEYIKEDEIYNKESPIVP